MTQIRMDVRDSSGKPLPELCGDILDLRLPVDHSRLAQSLLRILRNDDSRSTAHSVHFYRDGCEIGCWSLDRECAEAPRADADNVIRLRRPVAA